MADPDGAVLQPPFLLRLRLAITRRMHPRHKRRILQKIDILARLARLSRGKETTTPGQTPASPVIDPRAGDLVRVRSIEEIEATLCVRRQLKGCTFMEEMKPYCGTMRKILRPVTNAVGERDHKLKKIKGIVLLEDAICEGTRRFGPCDRCCYYFWRIEWLQKP